MASCPDKSVNLKFRVIPLVIGYHKDTLNCPKNGMNSVVSFNATIPINETNLPSKQTENIRAWLFENGYKEHFPCSVILYSRKCVGSHCYRMSIGHQLSETCCLRKTIIWALRNRIGDEVDYRSTVWNNPSFIMRFDKYSKIYRQSKFHGKMLKLTSAYDRLVSFTSIILIVIHIYIHSNYIIRIFSIVKQLPREVTFHLYLTSTSIFMSILSSLRSRTHYGICASLH